MPADGNGRYFMGNMMVTEIGGLCIKLTNKTGATSLKGYLCEPSSGTANAFSVCATDEPDIIGIVYGDDNGNQVADGEECWVVIQGIAEVYFGGNTTLEHFARNNIAADSYSNGQAVSEAAPSSPFATDKHFLEIGHVIESRVGAGLAKVVLHFN